MFLLFTKSKEQPSIWTNRLLHLFEMIVECNLLVRRENFDIWNYFEITLGVEITLGNASGFSEDTVTHENEVA